MSGLPYELDGQQPLGGEQGAASVGVTTLTLTGGNNSLAVGSGAWADPGATAIDTTDGDISGSIVVTGTVNSNVVGVYAINYSITNSVPTTVVKKRYVVVMPVWQTTTVDLPVDPYDGQRRAISQFITPPQVTLTYPNYWASIIEGAGTNASTGTEYFVSQATGSNGNNGLTEGTAWGTIDFAQGQLQPGNILTLLDETFSYALGEQLRITVKGTQAAPITIRSKTTRGALVTSPTGLGSKDATAQVGTYSGGWVAQENYWLNIEGIRFEGGGQYCYASTGAGHITVRDCEIFGSANDCIKNNSNADYNLYVNTKIHDSNQSGNGNSDGVDVTSSSYVILRYCEIYNIGGGHAYYFKKSSQFCLAEYCLIHDCGKSGGALGESKQVYNSVSRYNIVYNTGEGGIQIFGSHDGVQHNNTIYLAGTDATLLAKLRAAYRAAEAGGKDIPEVTNLAYQDLGAPYSKWSSSHQVYDNIFVVNHDIGGNAYMFDTGDPAFVPDQGASADQILELTSNYNNYFNIGAATNYIYNWKGADSIGLPAWRAYTSGLGKEQETNSTEVDPQFISVTPGQAGFLKPAGGSPMLNSGSSGAHKGAYATGTETIGTNW